MPFNCIHTHAYRSTRLQSPLHWQEHLKVNSLKSAQRRHDWNSWWLTLCCSVVFVIIVSSLTSFRLAHRISWYYYYYCCGFCVPLPNHTLYYCTRNVHALFIRGSQKCAQKITHLMCLLCVLSFIVRIKFVVACFWQSAREEIFYGVQISKSIEPNWNAMRKK